MMVNMEELWPQVGRVKSRDYKGKEVFWPEKYFKNGRDFWKEANRIMKDPQIKIVYLLTRSFQLKMAEIFKNKKAPQITKNGVPLSFF